MNSRLDALDRFESRRSTVYAERGAIATSQPLAATAGLDLLQAGGNAFDAAIAAAAVLNVVEPTSTGLGGDVFALYRTADGTVAGMRSCGGAPAGATIEAVSATRDDESPEAMPFRGPHTVTVPGTAAGWEALVSRHGACSLDVLLEPAISYAREGFPVTPVIADHWQGADDLFSDPYARETFLPIGRPPTAGERVTFEDLGESLESIASDGASVVYEGYIADSIVDTVQRAGGFLEKRDLSSFEPEFVDPIKAPYNGATVYQLPPNNQGPIVLEALRIAEAIGAGDHPFDSVDRLHDFIEAMKLAFHDGHRHITDPEFESCPPLFDDAWIRDRAERIGKAPLGATDLPPPGPRGEATDTVLVTVADADGAIVSLINSRFAGFGSGLVADGTGIALQNRGASFSLDPSHPNHLAPGKRPFHTLIPGIVSFGPTDWAAFGVMGGHMQPQGHLQVLSNIIDYGYDLQRALDLPRWRYREDGTVSLEPRFDPAHQLGLVRRGHDVRVEEPVVFGGAQIVRNQDGIITAATEPRKDGVAIGR